MDKKLLWQKRVLVKRIAKVDEEIAKIQQEIEELKSLIKEGEAGEEWKN